MNSEQVVKKWFQSWENEDYLNLPITEDFKHTSPFDTFTTKKVYIKMVEEIDHKGQEIHDPNSPSKIISRL